MGCAWFQPSAPAPSTTHVARRPEPEPTTPSDPEIVALVTEALTPQLCPKLQGSYLGLPGEGGATGTAAGRDPSWGRWWIRTCEARVQGDRIELHLGGNGWTWVDRQADGFRVRQYLLFDASASLSANVTVGFDRTRRIASLWMTPAPGVEATITPRGMVNAEAEGFFATVLGGVARVTGASVSERARTQAAEMGSTRLRERLAAGFTMTFALDTHQTDFMVGALQRGEVPERPFAASAGGPWLVNQRSTVWPGGVDVVGPFTAGAQDGLALDIALEEGDGASVQLACESDITRYFDARFRTPDAPPPPPHGGPLAELALDGVERHITLPAAPVGSSVPACPMVLLLSPRAGATLPARLRYRIAPTTRDAPAANVRRRVRIAVVGVTVSPNNPQGHAWDLVGGEADTLVVTASVPLHREIDRTPVAQDHNTATWNRWLPGTYDATLDLPLRFTVFDDDATSREEIGAADLDARALPEAAGEFSIPVRAQGTLGNQTGALRLRIENVP